MLQIVVNGNEERWIFRGLSGLLKTAEQENPKLVGQLIVIETDKEVESIAEKLKESIRRPQDKEIRYEGSKRYIRIVKELEVSDKGNGKSEKIPWKEGGVYLITGGVGGLGLIFAREIAEKSDEAKIILAGRSELDKNKEAQLKAIEELGSMVLYKQVDIGSKDSVKDLIRTIEEEYGRIDGVIHSAGVIRDNFIIKKTEEEFQEVLFPKVDGLVNIDEITKDMELDFLILFFYS